MAIGGTAVGTGINAHPEFGNKVAKFISENTGYNFVSSENKFHALTSHDEVVQLWYVKSLSDRLNENRQ